MPMLLASNSALPSRVRRMNVSVRTSEAPLKRGDCAERIDREISTVSGLLEACSADHPLLRTLCVTRLPRDPRECDVESFFARFGEVERVFVGESNLAVKNTRPDGGTSKFGEAATNSSDEQRLPRFALVTFLLASSAQRALEQTKSHKKLRVTWLKEKLKIRGKSSGIPPEDPSKTNASEKHEGVFLSSLPSFLVAEEYTKVEPKRANRHSKKSHSFSGLPENWSCRKPTKSLSLLSEEDARTFHVITNDSDPLGLHEEFGGLAARWRPRGARGTAMVQVTTLPRMPVHCLPPECNLVKVDCGYIQNYYLGSRWKGSDQPKKRTFSYSASVQCTSQGLSAAEKMSSYTKIVLNISWTWPLKQDETPRERLPLQQLQNVAVQVAAVGKRGREQGAKKKGKTWPGLTARGTNEGSSSPANAGKPRKKQKPSFADIVKFGRPTQYAMPVANPALLRETALKCEGLPRKPPLHGLVPTPRPVPAFPLLQKPQQQMQPLKEVLAVKNQPKKSKKANKQNRKAAAQVGTADQAVKHESADGKKKRKQKNKIKLDTK